MGKQAAKNLNRPQTYLLRWSDGRMSSGKHLQRPADVETLASFKAAFEKRIKLAKAK